ncbi:hypothetical protein ECG_08125 [Echinococcus granulosus]|nr:hypothetical protein ECG_08124 [Echinococcus granulosus]KAH9279017.1 hypothetical protein ECG_08125 [Echinococcus granulosus]
MAQCRGTVSTHSSAAPVTQVWSATNLLRRPTDSIEANDDCCVKCSATEEVKMCVDKQSGKEGILTITSLTVKWPPYAKFIIQANVVNHFAFSPLTGHNSNVSRFHLEMGALAGEALRLLHPLYPSFLPMFTFANDAFSAHLYSHLPPFGQPLANS